MLKNFFENKTRNSTDQMLFLIKSDIIEHLLFYFCFLIDLSNFYSNQTKPKKKKKIQIPENTGHKSRKKRSTSRSRRRDLAKARLRSTSRSRDGEIAIAIGIAISPSRDHAGKSHRREIATLGKIALARCSGFVFLGFSGFVFLGFFFFFLGLVWFE